MKDRFLAKGIVFFELPRFQAPPEDNPLDYQEKPPTSVELLIFDAKEIAPQSQFMERPDGTITKKGHKTNPGKYKDWKDIDTRKAPAESDEIEEGISDLLLSQADAIDLIMVGVGCPEEKTNAHSIPIPKFKSFRTVEEVLPGLLGQEFGL